MKTEKLSHITKNFILITFLLTLFISTATHAWNAKVVSVTDGDTIKVIHNGEQVKVRLYGVDTPEKTQAYGKAAKDFTASLVAGKTVDIEPIDTDHYGRTVGLVKVDGKVVNEELVKSGYAWVYTRYCKKDFCGKWIDFEAQARGAKVGLWSEYDPIPPWKFRAGCDDTKKKKKESATGLLHGNVKSRVLHKPGCKYYDCKNCTATFLKRKDAIKAGYKLCGICNP